MMPGLTLVSGFTDGLPHNIRVVDVTGQVVHRWPFEPTRIWPEESESTLEDWQTHVHGTLMLENGDLLVNYTGRDLIRMSPCGEVIWKLNNGAHHAIALDAEGNIIVATRIHHSDVLPGNLQNHHPPFIEFTVQKLTPDGELIWELSVNELLRDQGLQSLLYLSTLEDLRVVVGGDTLHMNDVEIFPETLPEGVFRHGDIMLSLSNINTIMVIHPVDHQIRWISTGKVLRQHDPDFIDGNTISIFDNNNLLDDHFDNSSGKRGKQGQSSRIVTLSASDDGVAVVEYDGTPDNIFFTDAMGSHQWLPNGNLMVIEARAGRVFEIAPDGTLIWEFFNIVEPQSLGAINDAIRLDTRFDRAFFERIGSDCST